MKVIYNGVDIANKVKISKCTHEMYCEGKSDQLTLKMTDNDGYWDEWSPKIGDTLTIVEDTAKTGIMHISSITPSSGEISLVALSIPNTGLNRHTSAWEQVKFTQICTDLSQIHGLSLKIYGEIERVFEYVEQDNQTDFEFLHQICVLEGCSFLVFDMTLVVYSQSYLEGMNAISSIKVTKSDQFEYVDASSSEYGSCEVRIGKFYGKYSIKDGSTYIPTKRFKVSSNAEALRYSKNILRDVNKRSRSGWFKKGSLLEFAPGSVLYLSTEQRKSWDSKVFITRIRNDYVNKECKVFFRIPLEGY
jgi:hypothetical protein